MPFDPVRPHNLPLLAQKNIDYTDKDLLLEARVQLAELKGYVLALPNPMLLINPVVLKESVESSNIENINTTVIGVLQNQLLPDSEMKIADKEAMHYRNAIMSAYGNLSKVGLSTRLILGIKKELLPGSQPGYRKQQNSIENSRTKEIVYTPPIASAIPGLISDWEKYVNNNVPGLDPIIKAAVAHYQFESIHPFEDGNGRTGRILMVLQLMNDDILQLPVLYVSKYINKNKSDYYRLLRGVTKDGNWEDYITFMLQAFKIQAAETKDMLFKIMNLFEGVKREVKEKNPTIYSADLVEALFCFPIITATKLHKEIGKHYMTAAGYLSTLAETGIIKDGGMHGKYHFYINERLLKIVTK